jgi:ADP-dependent NAD(P)H-hydrate dehydratase / NAD(P)H-hydrate epimerase
MKIVTATQMAGLDRRTIDEAGTPGAVLMGRAGQGIFEYMSRFIERGKLKREVVLFAGKGNNGGDTFVVARLLKESGIKNTTFVLTDPANIGGDAANVFKEFKECGCEFFTVENLSALEKHDALIDDCSLIVDGILGTGIRGEVRGFFAEVIAYINKKEQPVVAIDIPSGIGGDDGIGEGACINATATVTMAQPKRGCFLGKALNFVGDLAVVDIGVPPGYVEEVENDSELLMQDEMAELVPLRQRVSHKGSYGRLLVLAGSAGYTGAAAMTCMGALRAGAGLVYLGIPKSLNPILESILTETITLPMDETADGVFSATNLDRIVEFSQTMDAVIIGPGIGTSPETTELIKKLLGKLNKPLVLDADGLNCLGNETDCLTDYSAPLIVTPHPGEMARLTDRNTGEIMNNRWSAALDFSQAHKIITVLKGAGTVIADPASDKVYINITGNPGMATAGTGDVLSGMIGGFIGQGIEAVDAARLGVYMHGMAGDLAAEKIGQHSLIASDLINFIPTAFANLSY